MRTLVLGPVGSHFKNLNFLYTLNRPKIFVRLIKEKIGLLVVVGINLILKKYWETRRIKEGHQIIRISGKENGK